MEYATVARSLRSLRPHHSRIPPAQAFRQSWLRCERVTQRVITTGQPASEDINIAVETIMQEFISTETSQTAIACEQAALFGATPRPDEFDNREIWNEEEALRPPYRLRPPIPRRRRIAQHLLHSPAVDAEPPPRLVVAQPLIDNRQPNRRIELHAVHPPPLAKTDKGP